LIAQAIIDARKAADDATFLAGIKQQFGLQVLSAHTKRARLL